MNAPNSTEPAKPPSHKVLWSGGFLDGELTIFQPEAGSCVCQESPPDTVVIMWHMRCKTEDITSSGHFHVGIQEATYQFNELLHYMLAYIKEDYLKAALAAIPDGMVLQ